MTTHLKGIKLAMDVLEVFDSVTHMNGGEITRAIRLSPLPKPFVDIIGHYSETFNIGHESAMRLLIAEILKLNETQELGLLEAPAMDLVDKFNVLEEASNLMTQTGANAKSLEYRALRRASRKYKEAYEEFVLQFVRMYQF